MTADDMEREAQREFMTCPECLKDVQTVAAEGIPAQVLRACNDCDAVFFMDLESVPRYEPLAA